MKMVANAINERIAEKIGGNIELIALSFADITTKIPLLLASGDESDIVTISSNFAPYLTSYQTGGLAPLDELLKENASELRAMYKDSVWNATRINGKIYMIPAYYPQPSWPGVWTAKERTDKYRFDWENSKKIV